MTPLHDAIVAGENRVPRSGRCSSAESPDKKTVSADTYGESDVHTPTERTTVKQVEEQHAPDRASSGQPVSISVNFQALVEQSVDMICQVKQRRDGSMQYDYVSPSAVEIVGWTADEMKAVTHNMLYPPASLAIIREAGSRLDAGAPSTVVTVEAVRKDGRHIWLENRVRTLAVDSLGQRTVVVCIRDITDRKLMQDQLASLVLVDALTGVGNRRAFDTALDREWQHALARQSALSLLLIDVDFFKQINDTHGHQTGDECIRLVAQKVCQLLSRPEAFVARYGGDELAVLLPGIDAREAHDLGNRLCRGIATAALVPASDTVGAKSLTISCGASTAVGHKDSIRRGSIAEMPAGLIAAADRALYTAKYLGRNRAAVAEVG